MLSMHYPYYKCVLFITILIFCPYIFFKFMIYKYISVLVVYKPKCKWAVVNHGRNDGVQSVHSLYEVTERDRKLKPGRKVFVRGLCTLAMFLECTNAQGEQ